MTQANEFSLSTCLRSEQAAISLAKSAARQEENCRARVKGEDGEGKGGNRMSKMNLLQTPASEHLASALPRPPRALGCRRRAMKRREARRDNGWRGEGGSCSSSNKAENDGIDGRARYLLRFSADATRL
jgi:hypothetical protein